MHKAILNKYVNLYIPNIKKGRKPKVAFWKILQAIFYKIKTGIQWYLLPIKSLFNKNIISYQTVYYHYNKWCKMGVFEKIYTSLLRDHKEVLDCSIINLDGSHSPVKNGGSQVGYQGRKKSKTTNLLFLSDKTGLPLSISSAISGEHNDLYDIENLTTKMLLNCKKIIKNMDGLFLNADAGFDSQILRKTLQKFSIIANIAQNKRNSKEDLDTSYIFDHELYRFRFTVEQTNAWIDNYRSLIIRNMRSVINWRQSHYIACISLFIRNKLKINFNF